MKGSSGAQMCVHRLVQQVVISFKYLLYIMCITSHLCDSESHMPSGQTERDRTSYNDSIGDRQALMTKQAFVPDMLHIRRQPTNQNKAKRLLSLSVISNEKDI